MYQSDEKIDKVELEAEVVLENGEHFLGCFFVKQMQRLSDLLNDERAFLPFRVSDGVILQIRKDQVVRVRLLDQDRDVENLYDPYEIIGVSSHASDSQIKEIYHRLCMHYHPDKLESLDLHPDLLESAKSRLIRITDAYRRIQSMRSRVERSSRPKRSAANAH